MGSKESGEGEEEGMLHVKAVLVVLLEEAEGVKVGVHTSKVGLTPPPTLPMNCPVLGDTPAPSITTALHPGVGGRRFTPVTVKLNPPVGGTGREGEVAKASRIEGEYAKGTGEVMASAVVAGAATAAAADAAAA